MTGSTHIPYDKALNTGMKLITSGDNPNLGLLIVAGINLGLRIGDLLSLTFDDLRKESFDIIEGKTGKGRTLQVNPSIQVAITYFKDDYRYDKGGNAFLSQKGSIYSPQHVNRMLKNYFKGGDITTHSLRKSFGRRVWEANGETEKALMYLSEIFNHTSVSVTRKYLGIRDEEIKDIYMNL